MMNDEISELLSHRNMASNNTTSSVRAVHWTAAYRAAAAGGHCLLLDDIQNLRRFLTEERVKAMDKRGNTILHFLAVYGNVAALRVFLQESLVSVEELGVKNVNGDTALHEAARFGHKEAADAMLAAESSLGLVPNNLGETPLYVSAKVGAQGVFAMLIRYDPSESSLKRNDGCTVLLAAVMHEHYDLAMKILNLYPKLAYTPNGSGVTALNVLATKQHSFRSCSPFRFNDVGTTPVFFWQLFETIIYNCIPKLYKESKHRRPSGNEPRQDDSVVVSKRERSPFINLILRNGWLAGIDDAKQRHILAVMLARRLIELDDWNYYNLHGVQSPLIEATKCGITDLVKERLHSHPEAVETWDEENGSNILHVAAKVKNRFLYDYLLRNVFNKNRMLSDVDSQGNTVMHYAATLGGHKNFPHGPMNHLAWSVLWFKCVQYRTHPSLWNMKNQEGTTALEAFEKNHSTMREDAEKTIRDLANYGLILATLIATINFAAFFTVPGGFDQTTGLPIFRNIQHFYLFRLLFFLCAALAASVFNIGGLLSILNTKFDFDDFYIALPVKYILVILAMFLSSTFTILACSQAVFLEDVFGSGWYVILGTTIVLLATWVAHLEVSGSLYCYAFYTLRHLFSYKTQFT